MRPMLVSGTSPPAYDSGTRLMSSAPLRNAENWAFVFISDEPAYTDDFNAPPVRFSTSAAKRRHRRSRKSPSVSVPLGNWWEILSCDDPWAHSSVGTDPAAATAAALRMNVRRVDRILSP